MKDRIKKFSPLIDGFCVFYGDEMEAVDNLFLYCRFTFLILKAATRISAIFFFPQLPARGVLSQDACSNVIKSGVLRSSYSHFSRPAFSLMNTVSELTDLVAKIASEIQSPNAVALSFKDGESVGTSRLISSLTKSLNSVVDQSSSGTRVLDVALSLMCLKTTKVCSARIERMLETMISVLQSSVSCKVSRLGSEGPEFLDVGSSISFRDCHELLRVGADVLESLEDKNRFTHDLLHAVLRTSVFSSVCRVPFNWPFINDLGIEVTGTGGRTEISRLLGFLSDKINLSSHGTPLRLFFWYLDPLLLKNDISEILRESLLRPFLSLKAEFYNRLTWRRMILCFVTSPVMFRQASALLHSWFLGTGLAFVLELHIALISAVLDAVSRPMAWDISLEMGLKCPFAHAFFANSFQELLFVLNGSISCHNFVDLVHHIKLTNVYAQASLYPAICYSPHNILRQETILGSVDNNSTWSMLIKFPTWFYFAAVLFFYQKDTRDIYISEIISNEGICGSSIDKDLNEAAIWYLSFVLSPIDQGHGDSLAEHFLKLSRSWSLASKAISSHEQSSSSGAHNKVSLSCVKIRVNKDHDDALSLSARKCSFSALASWLKEFDSVCVKSWIKPFLIHTSADSNSEERSKCLFVKIPLGILILYSGILNVRECELLLYYATTGKILQFDYPEDEITSCFGIDGRKWAVDGACLVFSVFEIMEEISVMLFDCEAVRLDFICHLKGKVCKFLLRCVEILLHFCIQQLVEVGGRVVLLDLFKRLNHWKQVGRHIFEGYEELNNAIDGFAKKFLKLEELQEMI